MFGMRSIKMRQKNIWWKYRNVMQQKIGHFLKCSRSKLWRIILNIFKSFLINLKLLLHKLPFKCLMQFCNCSYDKKCEMVFLVSGFIIFDKKFAFVYTRKRFGGFPWLWFMHNPLYHRSIAYRHCSFINFLSDYRLFLSIYSNLLHLHCEPHITLHTLEIATN